MVVCYGSHGKLIILSKRGRFVLCPFCYLGSVEHTTITDLTNGSLLIVAFATSSELLEGNLRPQFLTSDLIFNSSWIKPNGRMTECVVSGASFLKLSVSHIYHLPCDHFHFKSFSSTLCVSSKQCLHVVLSWAQVLFFSVFPQFSQLLFISCFCFFSCYHFLF